MRLSRAARIRRTAHTRTAAAEVRREREIVPSTAWHDDPMYFAASRLHYPKVILAEVFFIIINHVS